MYGLYLEIRLPRDVLEEFTWKLCSADDWELMCFFGRDGMNRFAPRSDLNRIPHTSSRPPTTSSSPSRVKVPTLSTTSFACPYCIYSFHIQFLLSFHKIPPNCLSPHIYAIAGGTHTDLPGTPVHATVAAQASAS
jgi:hypothetical protein